MVPSGVGLSAAGALNEIVCTGAGIDEADAAAGDEVVDALELAAEFDLAWSAPLEVDKTSGGPFHSGRGVVGLSASSSFRSSKASSFIRLKRETRFTGAAVAVPPPGAPPGGTGFRSGFSTTVSRIGRTNGVLSSSSFTFTESGADAGVPALNSSEEIVSSNSGVLSPIPRMIGAFFGLAGSSSDGVGGGRSNATRFFS